jgi:hypothetical protein
MHHPTSPPQIAAALLQPAAYAVVLLLLWLVAGVVYAARSRARLLPDVLGRRLQPQLLSSLLVLVSFFYPSVAYALLSVFSCRLLDPSLAAVSGTGAPGSSGTITGSLIPGEELRAVGWYWAADLRRQCFSDPGHRALALGLGVPGALGLLAYPCLLALLLGAAARGGKLSPTSEWFGDYGQLVEDYRCGRVSQGVVHLGAHVCFTRFAGRF